MIELKDVNYSYDGCKALKDISLKVEKGESVSLLGPNGSGKSTLLKLINGLIFPESGTYSFDGEEITEKKLKNAGFSKRFHQRLGFVFQNSETQLFCSDVYDEIAFGPRQMGFDEKEVESRVDECLGLLNLQNFKTRQPYHLSGGEKKKVAIASVLALNPEVLVLDEPMNGLDKDGVSDMREYLLKQKEQGKTIIIIAHRLSTVVDADKIVVLSAGNVIEQGNHSLLYQNKGYYYNMWQKQALV